MKKMLNILIPVFLIVGVIDFFRLFNPLNFSEEVNYAKVAGSYLTHTHVKPFRHKENYIQIETGDAVLNAVNFRLRSKKGIDYAGIWISGGEEGDERSYFVFDELPKGLYYLYYKTPFGKRHSIPIQLDGNVTYHYNDLNKKINPIAKKQTIANQFAMGDTLFMMFNNELRSPIIYKIYNNQTNTIVEEKSKKYYETFVKYTFPKDFISKIQQLERNYIKNISSEKGETVTFYLRSKTKTYRLSNGFGGFSQFKTLVKKHHLDYYIEGEFFGSPTLN